MVTVKIKLSIAIAVLGAGGAYGAPLPDSPAPKVAHEQVRRLNRGDVNFWTNSRKIEFGTMVGLAAFDMGQTCHNLVHGGHEDFLPTRSCAGAVALTGAFDAAAIGGAWLLHRAHHDKLALIPMAFMSEQSLRAIVYSKEHHAW